MAIGARLTTVSEYLFRRLFKFLFRYDIFISYARRDGKGYALKLKEQLTLLDFSCFFDYDELPAGNSLNRTLKRALKKSAAIILIGTEGALKSHYVELEVSEFARTGRAIIPIDFEGTLTDAPWGVIKERDLVWVDESKDALEKSIPSPPVADAIDKLFKYTRRNVRVRGQVIATAVFFLLGAAISIFFIRQQVAAANVQRGEAEASKVIAQQQQREAEVASGRAAQLQRKAEEATDKLNEQIGIARKEAANAEKQTAIARAKAAEARKQQLLAEERKKLATSGALAASAMSQLQVDPELSLVLAGKSAEEAHTFEAENAMRRSLLESHVRAVAEAHRGEVTRASFTPDGEFAVVAGEDNTARVLRLSDGRVVVELRGHTKPLRSAAFSPDGKLVVTAGEDKTARVWDWRANRVVLELPHPEPVSSARFSPDGAAIITTSDDNAARVWDAQTGKRLSPVLYGIVAVEYHGTNEVIIKPFSPDGRHIFFVPQEGGENQPDKAEGEENLPKKKKETVYTEGHEMVWDVKTGRVLPALEKLPHVLSADVNPEHKVMVTYRGHPKGNGPAELWDLNTGRRFAVLREPNAGRVNSVALSPDGRLVVTANSDNTARVWQVPEKRETDEADKEGEGQALDKPLWVLSGHRGPLQSAAFSPDGRFILTASDDRTARVWDVTTGQEVSVLRGHGRGVRSAAFSPEGSRMVTSGDDGVARVWDAGMGQGFIELGQNTKVESASFAARNRLVLTTDDEQTARVWNAETGKSLPHTWPAHAAALSPDGKTIVTANQEVPRIYDAATGRVRVELSGQSDEALSAVYSPDGRFVAMVGGDKVVRVREAETGKVVKELPVKTTTVTPLLFSPGGGDLLLIGALVWDWKTERPPVALAQFGGQVSFGAFSPDGRLVAGPQGSAVAVWDARTGCRMKILMRHNAGVRGAVFGPGGRSLLSVDPYAAKLWQVPATLSCDGREEFLKESLALDHTKTGAFAKQSALLSPDGKFIVLTGHETEVQVWDADAGTLKFKLRDASAHKPGAALSPDGKLIVTMNQDGNARLWDSVTGNLLRTLEGSPDLPLSAASVSPDDKLVITVSDPRFNVLTLWDAGTGKRLGINLRGHSASFSSDGKSVLTVSGGDVARVSDVSTGRSLGELQVLTGKVTRFAFSDDGQRIAAVTSDRKVGVWETASGRNIARREYAGDINPMVSLERSGKLVATTAEVESNTVAHVWDLEADKVSEFGKASNTASTALSPDGRFVVTTTRYKLEGTKVFDIAKRVEVADLAGHFEAFSPDGKRMVTVSEDMARVWDTATWGSVAELRGHADRITSAAFSPDGKFIVTASKDRTALVWDAENGAVETGLFGDIGYGLSSAAFSPDNASILVVGEDKTVRLYDCVICGGWNELLNRARERFARHPRQLTPNEQKKFTRQDPSSVAGGRAAVGAVP